jgi:hypothetical protein
VDKGRHLRRLRQPAVHVAFERQHVGCALDRAGELAGHFDGDTLWEEDVQGAFRQRCDAIGPDSGAVGMFTNQLNTLNLKPFCGIRWTQLHTLPTSPHTHPPHQKKKKVKKKTNILNMKKMRNKKI